MGSPQNPTSDQIITLEKSGQLEILGILANIKISNCEALIKMQLPRQAIFLVKLTY